MATTKSAKTTALTKTARAAGTKDAKRAEALLASIERLKRTIEASFYALGRALLELKEKRLYAALGYASFEELLDRRGVVGHTQAYKLIAVVRALPASKAKALGIEKSYALAQLAKATPEDDTASDVAERVVRKSKASPGHKGKNLSSRQLLDAARTERKRHAKNDPEATAAARGARAAAATLRKLGVDGVKAEPVKARGRWFVDLRLPLETLDLVIDSLRRAVK